MRARETRALLPRLEARVFVDSQKLPEYTLTAMASSELESVFSIAGFRVTNHFSLALATGFVQQQATIQLGFSDIHTEIEHDDLLLQCKPTSPTCLVHSGFAPWLPFSVFAGERRSRRLDLRYKVEP